VEQWKLVGLITRRSLVRIQPPLPILDYVPLWRNWYHFNYFLYILWLFYLIGLRLMVFVIFVNDRYICLNVSRYKVTAE
jgi:hypothetical protein